MKGIAHLPSSLWGRLRRHPQPLRFVAGRALWWVVRGPLAVIPWPLSGARPWHRRARCLPTFVGWRDRLSQRIVGVAESLWERPS